MPQLTSLDLSGTYRRRFSCRASSRVPCTRHVCMVRRLYDVLAGRAAVRADNRFEDVGAASLAPGLMGMAQLTSLNLNGTLRRIGCALS